MKNFILFSMLMMTVACNSAKHESVEVSKDSVKDTTIVDTTIVDSVVIDSIA